MKHLKTKIAEYAVIQNDKNEVLLLRFSRKANPTEKWIFPGGRIDESEKPKEGLIREVKEETGLDISIINPIDVVLWGKGEDHRYAIFFICKLKDDKQDVKLSPEHQSHGWFSLDKLDGVDFYQNSFKEILSKTRENKKHRITVTALIFNDNKLLLIKHKRTGKWLHVGGHVEEGEMLDEALRREIKEEVNLNVDFLETYKLIEQKQGYREQPKPFYIHVKEKSDGSTDRISFDFICIAKNPDKIRILKSELEGYKWFSKEQIKKSPELWSPLRTLALKAFEVYENEK